MWDRHVLSIDEAGAPRNQTMMKNEPIGPELLATLLKDSEIRLSSAGLRRLWEYHRLLRIHNPRLNLTRIHNFENMVRKHYVDSLIVLDLLSVSVPLTGTIMDLGSGAGLPGIPLAIARPDLSFILAEGRRNRCEFLEETVRSIGLSNVQVTAQKVTSEIQIEVDAVISRAVASIPETLRRVSGSVKPGGVVIFMKGPNCGDEIEEARLLGSGWNLILDESYTLPFSEDHRRLVVYRRAVEAVGGDSSSATDAVMPNEHPGSVISSDQNARFKHLISLQAGRFVRKHGETIVSGPRAVRDFLAGRRKDAVSLIVSSRMKRGAAELADVDLPPVWTFSPELYREIDALGTDAPLLLVRTPKIKDWDGVVSGQMLFLPFGDPENLGAAMRSAAAFGFQHLVLLEESANPFHIRSVRASAGQCFQLEILRGPSTGQLGDLTRQSNRPFFVLEADGRPIEEVVFPADFGLIAGREGAGNPEGLKATPVSIPIRAGVESLNAAVALAVALFEIAGRPPTKS